MSQEPSSAGSSSLVYGISELPAALGVGIALTRKLIRNGDLPARKIGRRTVVLKEDVTAYLRSLPIHEAA